MTSLYVYVILKLCTQSYSKTFLSFKKVDCYLFALLLWRACWHSDLLIGEPGQGSDFCFLATRHQQGKQSEAPCSACFLGAVGALGDRYRSADSDIQSHRKRVKASMGVVVLLPPLVPFADNAELVFLFCRLTMLLYTWASCIYQNIYFLIWFTSNHALFHLKIYREYHWMTLKN